MKKATSGKVALINSRSITSRHTYEERITFFLSYLQRVFQAYILLSSWVKVGTTLTCGFVVEEESKHSQATLERALQSCNRKVNRARKTWLSRSVILYISLNFIIFMGSAAPGGSL